MMLEKWCLTHHPFLFKRHVFQVYWTIIDYQRAIHRPCTQKKRIPKNHWTFLHRAVWICISWLWDLQTTSFEIPWFLRKPLKSAIPSDVWSAASRTNSKPAPKISSGNLARCPRCHKILTLEVNLPPFLYQNGEPFLLDDHKPLL